MRRFSIGRDEYLFGHESTPGGAKGPYLAKMDGATHVAGIGIADDSEVRGVYIRPAGQGRWLPLVEGRPLLAMMEFGGQIEVKRHDYTDGRLVLEWVEQPELRPQLSRWVAPYAVVRGFQETTLNTYAVHMQRPRRAPHQALRHGGVVASDTASIFLRRDRRVLHDGKLIPEPVSGTPAVPAAADTADQYDSGSEFGDSTAVGRATLSNQEFQRDVVALRVPDGNSAVYTFTLRWGSTP